MANPGLGSIKQYQGVKGVDESGRDLALSEGHVVFEGSTGLVATAYGVRGLTASRLSTGIYQLNFPIAKGTNFHLSQETPSGYHYALSIVSKTSASGMAELHLGTHLTGTLVHKNPTSGTKVILGFSFHPRVTY